MGCPCGCSPLVSCVGGAAVRSPAAMRGDPVASKLEGLGGILPTIITPSDVSAYIARLDPSFRSTDTTVGQCPGLAPDVIKGWANFNTSWRQVADQGVHYLGSWEAQYEQIRKYEQQLQDWQEKISAVCPLSTPIVHGDSAGFPWLPVLVIGGLAIAAGAVGYSFYRTAKQASARANKGRELLEGAVDRQLSARFGAQHSEGRPRPKKKSSSTALARVR